MNKLNVLLISVILAVLTSFIYYQYFSYRTVSLESIENNPQIYNHAKITLSGTIIGYKGMEFGPKHYLAEGRMLSKDFDVSAAKRIALASKGGFRGEPVIDLSKLVSYTSYGVNYTQIALYPVIVKGTVIYVGPATDSPAYYLEVESIKVDLD